MDCDILIIGGGPAGMAAGIYAGRAELRTVILERMMVGGQVANTMEVANYPGFPESIDGPQLSDNMRKQAERFGVRFETGEAREVGQCDGGFQVELAGGRMSAKAVILAMGSDPRKLGVPGEEELRGRGVSYCGTCDAPFFRDRRVVVVGGGDTALKEGLHLAKFASHVTLVHRRDALRGEKIYQRQILDHEKMTVRWNAVVTAIQGDGKVQSVALKDTRTSEESEMETDGVFIFVGTVPNTAPVLKLLSLEHGDHVATDLDMMTSVPGLFAVGDLREHSYRQVATAVGEGATAAMAADHYLARLEAQKT